MGYCSHSKKNQRPSIKEKLGYLTQGEMGHTDASHRLVILEMKTQNLSSLQTEVLTSEVIPQFLLNHRLQSHIYKSLE